jgi:ABC-type multidrug transport system fused ATPase/permease subunit
MSKAAVCGERITDVLDLKPDIRDYTLASLRDQIAVVLQESVLFNASIRDNIAYGRLDASEEEIAAAAQAANAHDFIMTLRDGYDTIVGERGANLSGGQRQRIAIARAFIRDASILILDEPLTGLDRDNESAIRVALQRLMRGRTTLIITHDPETARLGHRVLTIRDGKVTAASRALLRADAVT